MQRIIKTIAAIFISVLAINVYAGEIDYKCPPGEVVIGVKTEPTTKGAWVYVTKGVICAPVKQVVELKQAETK